MSKSAKDDDQVFVVMIGTRNSAESADCPDSGASGLVNACAIAIAMMILVTLVNDSDRRRWQDRTVAPNGFQAQPTRTVTFPR